MAAVFKRSYHPTATGDPAWDQTTASKSRYAVRNRCLVLTSFWSGMRVGEIANLKMRDVLNEDRTIKTEIRLSASQTKGDQGRVVFIPQKLRDEFANYLKTRK